ncbi:hypothetical protein K523DRAFT_320696 [Schizophyllum commune Tattone D]|uniref:uncharacterized protein n=1 Tax=Schizophyllum commune (strain H4-8 / FGSC 9210) TaxID=578458 RepID=UPI002160BD5A|nr:uncharacterized protein SCHCODRAFT_02605718 [Schizophyllum commune H4-8]KAI5835046.1 hypothetical protein K523DRAFT_320696 [Schizophyllum commune Tattone D]KAI5899642.1 hypothetical protein SCHCODRAFT_02605718 [Schizophyllum commune H4-8]
MCRLRQVTHKYAFCGHRTALPDQEIKCDNRHCRFSTTHGPGDCGPNCRSTCWTYRAFPEQYELTIQSYCPDCQAAGRR